MNFYKTNPISSLGLKGMSPVVRLVRIRRMLDPSAYRHIRRNFFRVHCQFVRANDCRCSYDYFMFLCGPLSAEAQIHSPSGATLAIGSDGRLLGIPDATAQFVQYSEREVICHTDDCQGCLRSHGGWLVPYSFPACSAITPHPGFSQREGRQRDCTAACFTHWPWHPAIFIRLQRSFSFRELSIPTNHSVGGPPLSRWRPDDVLSDPSRAWTELVGDIRGSAKPYACDRRYIRTGTASDVHGLLAVGTHAGTAFA